MNNIRKIFIKVFIINILILGIYLNIFKVFGASTTDSEPVISLNKIENSATGFIEQGSSGGSYDTIIDSVTKNFKSLGQILTFIGAGILVVVTSYMGIQYLTATPDKQAALKQQLVGLVVSGVVIFGAYGIWKAIIGVVSNF